MAELKKLPDLAEVIEECKKKIDAVDASSQVDISAENASALLNAYRDVNPKNEISLVGGHTFVIGTGEQTRHISIQEMPVLSILADNLRALEAYRVALDKIALGMGFKGRSGDGRKFFETMPNQDWRSSVSEDEKNEFLESVDDYFTDDLDKERFLRFVSDPEWSGMGNDDGKIGRKLNRSNDWQESAILKTGGLVAAASAGRVNLIRAIEAAGFGANLVDVIPPVAATKPSSQKGENVIFYGAPGTGKSNKVNEKIKAAGKKPFRTVFHPDLQNSDFFGCLKPQMNGKDVRYGFSPGPFMSALAEARKNPGEPVYLVIEELNRAAAAAVFGDLFLLLDRDDDGAGEYDVSFPSTESQEWFESTTETPHETLLLPSNLFIYATMNSADQGVYPIDTAFRRRWRQEYLPLDYDKGPEGDVSFVDAAGNHHPLAWRKFVKLLNRHLVSSQTLGIAEDRLLGQWFVKNKELDGDGIPDKVLLYLWDDLLRHEGREHIFDAGTSGKVKTYGDLVIEAAAGRRFLSDSFLGKLNAASDVEPEQEDETGDDAP
ncbi:MAG: AAA family ATPase [Yoonia sp.]